MKDKANAKRHQGILRRAEMIKKVRDAQVKVAEYKSEIRSLRVALADLDIELVKAGVLTAVPTMSW